MIKNKKSDHLCDKNRDELKVLFIKKIIEDFNDTMIILIITKQKIKKILLKILYFVIHKKFRIQPKI